MAKVEAASAMERDGALPPPLLLAAIEACPVNITISDLSRPDSPLIYVNRAFCETTGYAREEVLGRNCRFLQGEGTDRAAVETLRRAIRERRPVAVELLNYRRCGAPFLNRLELAPICAPTLGLDACVGIQRDITAFRAQEATRRQREKLEAIGRLASGFAHELNNLLQPVVTHADLLARGGLSDKRAERQACEDMLASARAARALTAKVLQFARRGAEGTQAEPASQRLGAAIGLAATSLPPGVRLDLRGVDQLRGPCALAPGELVQVFHNLFKNAAEAMRGEGIITIEARELDRDILLVVADTGPGVPPEAAARLFEPFFTTKPPGEGTGLGLAAVWGLVHGWGGAIALDPQPGQGARFRLRFPLIPNTPSDAEFDGWPVFS